jgi:amino acid adenylation domain-containing protein
VLNRPTTELASLVAVTANLVPVPLEVDNDAPADDFIRKTHATLTASLRNSAVPFNELAERFAQRNVAVHPLVQVAFGMHDSVLPGRLRSGHVDARVEELHAGGAQFDAELFVRRANPGFGGSLEHATSLWSYDEAQAFIDGFAAAVAELANPPGSDLKALRCLSPSARARLAALNRSAPLPAATTITQRFLDQASRTPNATAVTGADGALTYEELRAAADRQSRVLQRVGCRQGDVVVVALPRSVAETVAVLAVLRAGAVYAGVEPATPSARLAATVHLLHPAAVICDARQRAAFPGLPAVPGWPFDHAWPVDHDVSRRANRPDDPAYIALTSGSTGTPKGVVIPHRAVLRLIDGLDGYASVGPADTMLRASALAFDASTLELWGALLRGARLHVLDVDAADVGQYARTFIEAGVTVAWLTSGLFRLLSDHAPVSLRGLRVLLTGGDVVPAPQVRTTLRRNPGLTVVNGYGPTESTTFTTTHWLTDAAEVEDPLPIGRPVAGTSVYVLDSVGGLLPPGAVGELHIGGTGLAIGYLGLPGETASRFGMHCPQVPERLYRTGDLVRLDRHDRLHFLGRVDDQVKVRGCRVEMREIRYLALEQPGVADAVVVATGVKGKDRRLLLACVPDPGGLRVPDLADGLAGRLPAHAMPSLWAVVESFPVTANGKLDRDELERVARPLAAF